MPQLKNEFWHRPTGEPLRPEEFSRGFLEGVRFPLSDSLIKGVSLHVAKLARSRGSITKTAEEIFITPAFKVHAVDTTGACDFLHGVYLYRLLQGRSLYETMDFAFAMAALKYTKIGGMAGIPSLDVATKLLKNSGQTLFHTNRLSFTSPFFL